MSLLDQIRADSVAARKDRSDPVRISLLITLLGEVVKKGKDKDNSDTTDVDAVGIVKKFVTGANEVAKYGSAEQKVVAAREIEILGEYLPKQLQLEQLATIISAEIVRSGNGTLGPIMKFLKTNYEGQYDGAVAKAAFESLVTLQP